MAVKSRLNEKMREGVAAVLPIALIVMVLCFTITPIPTDLMLAFVIGTVMLIVGMGLFTYGAEASMTPIGSHIGAKLTKSRNLLLILSVSFLLGVIITIAEPDLQVLAGNVPHIDSTVLILTVSVGVGFFLLLCMLRILLGVQLRWLLLFFYGVVFILAGLSDPNFLSVAFDSGGVTTGPMTVPFIMALGIGVASIRSDKNAQSDSFGLVALCSVGPILAVLILGFIYRGESSEIAAASTEPALDAVRVGAAQGPGTQLPFRMALLAAGRVAGSPAGAARTTRPAGLSIGFVRRRAAGTAGETAFRSFRGRTSGKSAFRHLRRQSFRRFAIHLGWLIRAAVFRKS